MEAMAMWSQVDVSILHTKGDCKYRIIYTSDSDVILKLHLMHVLG